MLPPQGFRVVRFYAWEPSFLARLTGIRADELAVLRRLSLIRSCVLFIFMLLPSLVSLTAFSGAHSAALVRD